MNPYLKKVGPIEEDGRGCCNGNIRERIEIEIIGKLCRSREADWRRRRGRRAVVGDAVKISDFKKIKTVETVGKKRSEIRRDDLQEDDVMHGEKGVRERGEGI